MSDTPFVRIEPARPRRSEPGDRILLLKPPYFTPWTPPLGIAILKSFLERHGHRVTCFDFNTDPELWGMHHKYFSKIQTLEDVSINDGYSKLWWILNAHLLAYANGATAAEIARVLEVIIPLYGIRHDAEVIADLIPIVERYFRRLGEVTDRLDLADYTVVGTSTYTTSLASSLFLLKRMKAARPELLTVMGGGIFADDLALGSDNLETLVAECHYIDHVVLGEGEMLFLKLLDGELRHKRVISIADLKGQTLEMKDVPTPDFSDLNVENYYHLSIEGARSCPFQCSFCSETIQWGDYRKKPTDIFADQVTELSQKFNVKEFFMGDSLMNPYINPFALELIERKAGILYDGYLRADKPVANRKFVKLWADSGLFRVRLGIESAAARVLDSMDKMTTPQVISNALKSLASAGIRTTTYWICGFPGETDEDFRETCDFIKAHHPYIYELEAHPYYYYPYGQVGSRLYESYSLYPEEVTRHTKFKAWEIVGANPRREVRYERLRHLSKLAAELGLPNIYSMAERYQAEDRWHALQPLAAEVYQDTHTGRGAAAPPAAPLRAFSEEEARAATDAEGTRDALLCFRASVSRKVEEGQLAAAVVELVKYNEMLQVSLSGGEYVARAASPNGESLLSVYELEGADEASLEAFNARASEDAARALRPSAPDSLRVALGKREGKDAVSEILLFVHRAVTDAAGVCLLFEDLFRIYEQLAAGRAVSLRPVPKTYSAFVRDFEQEARATVASGARRVDETAADDNREVETVKVEVGRSRLERINSKPLRDDGVTTTGVILQALLRCLGEGASEGGPELRIDYRFACEELRRTVGPLTRTYALPALPPAPGDERSGLLATQRALAALLPEAARGATEAFEGAERLLLNFEYCVEEPWLGGDLWTPRGFVLEEGSMRPGCPLEVVPAWVEGDFHVLLKHRGGAAAVVAEVAGRLLAEVEAILRRCEAFAAAKEFWLEEFGQSVPAPVFLAPAVESDEAGATAAHRGRVSLHELEELAARCEADPASVMLAAYAVLLGRTWGLEDLSILVPLAEGGGAPRVPVRLRPSWTRGFGEFAREVGRRVARARSHGEPAAQILAEEFPRTLDAYAQPEFELGFTFEDGAPAGGADAGAFEPGRGPKLTLALKRAGGTLDCRFEYARAYLDPSAVERLADALDSILVKAGSDVNIPLEDAALADDEKVLLEKSLSIEELDGSFSF